MIRRHAIFALHARFGPIPPHRFGSATGDASQLGGVSAPRAYSSPLFSVMPGLDPGIHGSFAPQPQMDSRVKPENDYLLFSWRTLPNPPNRSAA